MNNMLEYQGYYGSIEYSAADECFHGKIVGINDLVTYEGEGARDIKASFIEAVDDYLLMCERIGKEPQKIYKGTFNIRISPELHQKAALLAANNRQTLNAFIENAIMRSVQNI